MVGEIASESRGSAAFGLITLELRDSTVVGEMASESAGSAADGAMAS